MHPRKTTEKAEPPNPEPSGARDTATRFEPPRHIVWSTDTIDLADPFQRQHYIRQVLLHGRTEDVRRLNLHELASMLNELRLPTAIHTLWERFLREQGYDPR